ncbi:MAG: pyridoxal phosphate-dependent aminotransferase family protein, partial [Ruminococcaceae bacterium]|nr:pyridoxal phosphate-dependent aminotransferase family protein [Oscillospiraceae bacterium]
VADYVRHSSRPFIFSASITPVSCATALAALRELREHPELVDRLSQVSQRLRSGLIAGGVKVRQSATPIVPIFTYDVESTLVTNRMLYDAGVYVNPVLPPQLPPPSACCAQAAWQPTPMPSLTRRLTSSFRSWSRNNARRRSSYRREQRHRKSHRKPLCRKRLAGVRAEPQWLRQRGHLPHHRRCHR